MSAYYNEHDPFAAAWLRELIKAGHINDGEVDERSIEDVRPDELAGFTQCHFFAGIGGWSLALRLAGWPDDRPVWTGSCPCQPFSSAGKGAGTADERHLWPAFFHLIEQQRPDVVFGEQVEAAIKHGWLDLVQDDLEGIGYAFAPVGLPAASVGAPHIRARAWFVADRNQNGRQPGGAIRSNGKEYDVEYGGAACGLANSESERVMREPDSVNSQTTGQERGHMHVIRGAGDVFGNMANTGGFWSNADWLPCRDGKARPVESATERMADGLSDSLGLVRLLSYPNRPHEERLIYSPLIQKGKARVGRLRGYGNAIVPEVAQAFIESYLGINL